jgi:hypothetical protein
MRFNAAENTKIYVGIRIKYRYFWSDINKMWGVLTDFDISPQHQISHKSVQWEPRCT